MKILEMWIYRKMQRIQLSYQQHTSNRHISIGFNITPQLIHEIKKNVQVFWTCSNGENYEDQHLLLEGTVDGTKR